MNILIIIIIIIIILLILNCTYFHKIENFKCYSTLQQNYNLILQPSPIIKSDLQIPQIPTIQVIPNSLKNMKNFLFE
jgi:hypothetical protein